MSDTSTNLLLPYLAPAQAQKHVTVNEALRRLDALVQLAVVSATTSAQPGSPSDGEIYIVPAGKTGAQWGGYTNWALAYYRDGAWEQITPREGWLAFVKDSGFVLRHTSGGTWASLAPALQISASDKLLGRVSSGAGAAEEVDFSDLAQTLAAQTTQLGFAKEAGLWRPLAGSAVAASHTGSTTETALATVSIPAGAMGANGALRIWAQWSFTNNANNKSLRTRLGGLSGTQIYAAGFTTQVGFTQMLSVMNRNSESAQLFGNVAGSSGGLGVAGGAWPNTGAVNMSVAQDLVLSGALANTSDSVTLEGYQVELLYRG